MKEQIEEWFSKHFRNNGLESKFYNLALAAKDDLLKLFGKEEAPEAAKEPGPIVAEKPKRGQMAAEPKED